MRLVLLAAMSSWLCFACAVSGPVVESHTVRVHTGTLERVAVLPFVPAKEFAERAANNVVSPAEAGTLVARFVAEALEARGVQVVTPNDAMTALEAAGVASPKPVPAISARIVSEQFGATAIVVGTLHRYRERVGEALGSQRPARVWFEYALHAAPSGEKVWTARFDQTQQPLSANLFVTRRYPGAGSRWLSAAEFARWGAEETVSVIPEALQ